MYQEYQAEVQVQDKDLADDPDRELPQDTPCSETSENDLNVKQEASLSPNTDETDPADTISKESEPALIQHQWFIDSFSAACSERGVEADLTLNESLASALDNWITQRLRKKSFLGNKFFYDEKPNNIQAKVNQIVSEWDFIEISYLGERVQIPAVPDLKFLVTYREQIFSWVSEQRQHSLNRIFAQFETMAASEEYEH